MDPATRDRREQLEKMLRASISRGKVKLSSGGTSDFYVDAREVTLDGDGSIMVGEEILSLVQEYGFTAIAGPITAACPMVSAAGVLIHQSLISNIKLNYVRSEAKTHGLGKMIEGAHLTPDDRVLLVDDVLTSGGSLIMAAFELIEAHGPQVEHAFVLVDRQAGGKERLAEAEITLHSLFTRADLEKIGVGDWVRVVDEDILAELREEWTDLPEVLEGTVIEADDMTDPIPGSSPHRQLVMKTDAGRVFDLRGSWVERVN